MRIIAGEHKSRKLKEVKSSKTRPTTDKNKESLFSILGPLFDGETFLDLFAGSGAIGIEALSRGCSYCVFVDNFYQATSVIKNNLNMLHILDKSLVLTIDAYKALHNLNQQFDYIFLDPPYKLNVYDKLIRKIIDMDLLKPEGCIICESELKLDLPKSIDNLTCYREMKKGISKFNFYKWSDNI